MNVDRFLFIALLGLTVFRLILAAQVETTPDEAFLWIQSQHPATAYLENGPVLPTLIGLSSSFIADKELAPRFWNPLFILLSTAALYLLCRSMTNQVVARWVSVLFNVLPMTTLDGLTKPLDTASVSFGLLALWTLWCAFHRAKRWHWLWPCTGFLLGLAALTSFTNIVLFLSVLIIPTASVRWRGQWRRPGIYTLAAAFIASVGSVCALPGSYLETENIAILSLSRTYHHLGFYPLHSMGRTLITLALFGPLCVAGIGWTARRLFVDRPNRQQQGQIFLIITAVGTGTLTIASMLFFESDTLAPLTISLLAAAILMVRHWTQVDLPIERKASLRQLTLTSTAVLSLLLINTDLLRALGLPWPYKRDWSSDQRGWKESARDLAATIEEANRRTGRKAFVIAETPATAAILDYYLPHVTPVFQPDRSYPRIHAVETTAADHQYALWPSYRPILSESGSAPRPLNSFIGGAALYVTQAAEDAPLPANLRHAFRLIDPAAILHITRRGQTLRQWAFYHCFDYQGLPF